MKHATRDNKGRFTKTNNRLKKSFAHALKEHEANKVEPVIRFPSERYVKDEPDSMDLFFRALLWFTAGMLLGMIIEMMIKL